MDGHNIDPRLGEAAKRFLVGNHQAMIGGRWVDAASGKTFDTYDPSTGKAVAQVAECDAADVDAAVAAARRAFENGPWRTLPGKERARLLWKLADLMEANAEELVQLESLNGGKPIGPMREVEMKASIDVLRYMAGWATKLNGHTIQGLPTNFHAFTLREPIGVVGQIIPWNSPIMMASWKLGPALAAGCTIVLKPAEQTPLTALRLGQLIEEAGFPDGVVNILPGFGPTVGAAIAAHPDVDKVAFTGSGEVGRLIMRAACGNLKKVSLELGGKSPVIVFPDADLSVAVPGAARAIFNNAGQICAAGSRLYAHAKVFDKMVEGITAVASSVRLGQALDVGTQMGPLVSQEQLERVSGYVEQGSKAGANIVTGGARVGTEGYFFAPTVLTKTDNSMSIVREEIFGPVLCAMRFDDDDLERIAEEANRTIYGLAASVWTRDLGIAHKMVQRIRAGTVGVNMHGSLDAAMPFGGYKQSGWGRERGGEVLDLYTEVKAAIMSF